jgi:hypothetical protein
MQKTRLQLSCLLVFALLVISCENSEFNEQVARYRASLQLSTAPLSYKDAMKSVADEHLQGVLERLTESVEWEVSLPHSNKATRDINFESFFTLALDTAVRIENVIRRANWSGLESRNLEPSAFDALVRRSLAQANELAFAAVSQDSNSLQQAAEQLLSTCQFCHEHYR